MTTTELPPTDTIQDNPPTTDPFAKIRGKQQTPRAVRSARRASNTPLPPWREGAIAAWSAKMYTLAGVAISRFDPGCGAALQASADAAGGAWERLAKQNNTVRRWFAVLMQGSVISELVLAHAPLIVAVLSHHGPFRTAVEEAGERFQKEFTDILRGEESAAA